MIVDFQRREIAKQFSNKDIFIIQFRCVLLHNVPMDKAVEQHEGV
jgi:hypothetical protein